MMEPLMIDWWSETDDAIVECLRALGPTSPEELSRRIGLSVGDVSAFLAMLVRDGRVRIRSVDLTSEETSRLSVLLALARTPSRPAHVPGSNPQEESP
jgi:DNA-binding Lrp family transcriptional regulator